VIMRHVFAGTVALACASVLLAAQPTTGATTQQQPTPGATTAAPAAGAQQSNPTMVGCLYRENQIPGRTPNVAERAGILEDYILADASMASPQGTARPGATPGAAGTTGSARLQSGNMYKVENIPDERLKALVGKRVEVVGHIDPEGAGRIRPPATAGAPVPDKGLGPDQINLPEFEAASIREVSGTCPATPAPRSK
jgi:hypothetical protein